ncbi:MAG: virulence RhuM family protein [Cardiobacteriaceae bacterium]|nr:virulence RhuM family protein [Cardiobacteriaceae bacterium]
MTNFSGNYITKSDVGIAKNYLNEKELQILNLLVSRFFRLCRIAQLEGDFDKAIKKFWNSK